MTTAQSGRPVQAFFGAMLIAVGLLVGGLSGLCTAAGVAFGVADLMRSAKDGAGFIGLALGVGFIPIVVGVGLFVAGRALLDSARPPKPVARLDDAP